jgi:hypothetical protein
MKQMKLLHIITSVMFNRLYCTQILHKNKIYFHTNKDITDTAEYLLVSETQLVMYM